MSTTYELTKDLHVTEQSTLVEFCIVPDGDYENEIACAERLNDKQLRRLIIKLVEILSYISDDPSEALSRFNVDYGQEE